jgi:hypothetical protein
MPRGDLKPEDAKKFEDFVEAVVERVIDDFGLSPTNAILRMEDILLNIDAVEAGKKLKDKAVVSLDRVAKVMREDKKILSCEGDYHGFDFSAHKINFAGDSSEGLRIELLKRQEKKEG